MSRVEFGTATARAKGAGFWSQLVLDRLHRMFAIVIVVQFLRCFTGYWWDETYSVMYAVLVVTAVCELAFTRWPGVRLALETLAALLICAHFSPFFTWLGWSVHWNSALEWNLFYQNHIAALHPFFELAAGQILLVHFLSWAGRSRQAMVVILVGSIAVMATLDSFYPLELWQNIAWIVAAGLGWLVVLHLRELRSRHPESWTALAQHPFDLALPAFIVISLLLLSGIFMPKAPALLEDPYTLWNQAQGRDVQAFAGEGGVLRTNLGGLGSGGSASSGYGRDDRHIGGGFNFDYSPVMTVQTTRRSYWRGETKAVYTGKGWDDRPADGSVFPIDRALTAAPARPDNAKTEKITQTVTLLRKDRIPVLFGAGPINRLTGISGDNIAGYVWNPEEWELRLQKPARIHSYKIESGVTQLEPAALRALPDPTPASAAIDLDPYLQLPRTVPARVRNLAADVTAAGTNEYDKAVLLERFLKDNFPYTNKPEVSKQKSADVTDAFLFEIKEGYCDYYSTAFVVMARSVGIPARWVKGYAPGFNPAVSDIARYAGPQADPDAAGTYTVRNADAHSWAEVYFEGHGWFPFEPTSGFSVPQPVPQDAASAVVPEPVASAQPEQTPSKAPAVDWRLPAAGAAALVLAASVWLLRTRRVKAALLWNRIRYAGSSPDQRIVREMERLLKYMRRKGLKRETHETIRESFIRWGDRYASMRPEFEGILLRFERARYGRDSGEETEAREFVSAVEKLRKAL